MPFPSLGVVLLPALLLTGCGCPVGECSMALVAGADGLAHAGPALEATADQFLGPQGGGVGTGRLAGQSRATPSAAGGLPRLVLDRDTLAPDSTTPHQVLTDRRLGLRVQASRPLSAGFGTHAALTLAAGQSRHVLPQGLGPLTDPLRIGFDRVSATPELGVHWSRPLPLLPEGEIRVGASAGQEISRVRTRLRSDLLDVRHLGTVRQGFVALEAGIGLRPASGRARLEAAVRLRQDQDGDRQLQSELRLQH